MADDTGIALHGPKTSSQLVMFAHGANGSMHAPEVSYFRDGVARVLQIVTFNNKGPLDTRSRHYRAVLHQVLSCDPGIDIVLGGRSLGARAAVEIARDEPGRCRRLVLVSYALHRVVDGVEECRHQPLLELNENVEVLFVIGGRDRFCHLDRLEIVRKRMRNSTWLIEVEGADHMMSIMGDSNSDNDSQQTTRLFGTRMGELAAEWVSKPGEAKAHNGVLRWSETNHTLEWSGWH